MAQTRMFRDRVVSMEQTLEGGEKHLDLLKALCSEAIPDFAYTGHVLDHERDLFVIELQAADGRKKTVAFTRMVLYDAERIPAIVESPSAPVREKVVLFLRSRMSRPEIVVTFRHVEDGFVDTPEARPSRRRGRRGGRGGKGAAFAQAPPGSKGQGRPGQRPGGERRPHGGPAPARPALSPAFAGRPTGPPPPSGGLQAAAPGGAPERSGRRRRSRRRRRRGGAP
ncbi:MAG TPA: hypothetical protein VGS00_01500 [Thermoanaerobaculia bacterium]|nr:hypothetical protein [Thermoanaerobaculia bacterium]